MINNRNIFLFCKKKELYMDLINETKNAVIKASTSFRKDQFKAYYKAFENEKNPLASWILELLIKNAKIADENKFPLCDDTGVPHILVEMGKDSILPVNFMAEIKQGIKRGLQELPGRPMAVRGNDLERIEQKKGLYDDPGKLIPPSFILDQLDTEINNNPEKIRIHILMLGGGPEIRAKTYRVFHKRDYKEIFKEIIKYMKFELPKLGCTPCIPAVGVGRTHFEASTLMLKAMAYGNLEIQSDLEMELTQTLNSYGVGALNMGGSVTALGSFIKIGPQRASGVRILCMRPCCCVEPRVASFDYYH
jgi:fumarate hydratase subunit alpha